MKIFFLGAILINFYLTLSITPLFNLDEGVFAEATREMLINHNFITTYLNGHLRFDKPILIYWLQAISIYFFGLNTFAIRLPSAIAATFWSFGIYFFTKKLFDDKIAVLSAFFMATTLQITLIGKAAMADSLLNMFIAFSMLSLYLYLKENKEKYLLLSFAFIGFGVLTKGPIAILIPLATYFTYALIKKEFKKFLKDVFNIKGLIIFSIIALPWYILEYHQEGMKFIKGFFLKNNIKRFDTTLERHGGSIFYYIPVILIGLLPWSGLFVKYLISLKNLLKNDFIFFGSIWFFFVFIFFSISGTKLPHYIIYGYTPLFIFMALIFEKVKNDFWLTLPFILFLLIMLVLPFVLGKIHSNETFQITVKTMIPYFNIFYFLIILTFLILCLIKFNKEIKIIIIGFGMIFIVNYAAWIYAHVRAIPLKEAAVFVKKHHLKNILMYNMKTPSFNFYSNMITPIRKPKRNEIVLIKLKDLKNFKYQILFKKGTIAIVKIKGFK